MLWAGQVAEALVDITGGLADRWTVKNYRKNNDHVSFPEKSKFELMRDLKDKSFISCSVHGSNKGKLIVKKIKDNSS